MTTNEGLVIGGLVIGGGILIYAMSTKKKLTASASTGSTIAGIGGLLSGLGSFAKGIAGGSSSSGSPPASYSSLSSPNGVSYVPDTATSNYLADLTAQSDTASGVVGFGGWED